MFRTFADMTAGFLSLYAGVVLSCLLLFQPKRGRGLWQYGVIATFLVAGLAMVYLGLVRETLQGVGGN